MELTVHYDDSFFLAKLRQERQSVYQKVRPLVEQNPLSNPVNVSCGAAGFILRRRSKLFGKTTGLAVTCCGYVDLPPHGTAVLRGGKNMPLVDVWRIAGRWPKGEARVTRIYYKDSPVSGFLARRLVLNNNFTWNEIMRVETDAEWRASNDASANPNIINGAADEFEELNADGRRQCINFD